MNELKEISPALPDLGAEAPYTVPAGYFDGLAAEILLKINARHDEDAALSHISKAPIYEVPAGYFEGLANTVLNRVRASAADSPADELAFLSPVLSRLDRKSPFKAPEGYFNDLSDNVVSGVQAIEFVNEELENLSPLMASLRKARTFETPPGYFEQLPEAILAKVRKQPAKVISVSFRKRVIRYAAAAVVVGVVAIGSYIGFRPGHNPAKPDEAETVVKKDLDKVPDQDIESFLTTNTVALADAGTIVTNDSLNENDAKDLLANVSDDELQSYLEEHGVINKPATN